MQFTTKKKGKQRKKLSWKMLPRVDWKPQDVRDQRAPRLKSLDTAQWTARESPQQQVRNKNCLIFYQVWGRGNPACCRLHKWLRNTHTITPFAHLRMQEVFTQQLRNICHFTSILLSSAIVYSRSLLTRTQRPKKWPSALLLFHQNQDGFIISQAWDTWRKGTLPYPFKVFFT